MTDAPSSQPAVFVAPSDEPFLRPLVGAAEELRAVVEPVVRAQGLELIELVLVRGARRDLLRLSVDRPGAGVTPGLGVNMAELEKVNRTLGDLLDVEDQEKKLFGETWELEVGSPGVDRPLTRASHFPLVIGQQVKVRLRPTPGGKKTLVGVLTSADTHGVTVDGATAAWSEIDGAHVVYQFEAPARPGKAGGPKRGRAAASASDDATAAPAPRADKAGAKSTAGARPKRRPKGKEETA